MAQFRERVSVVCVHENKILCFLAIDPTSGKRYFFLPGGGLEAGETQIQCGERETWEETGYRVQTDSTSHLQARYPFLWDGKEYDSLTHFYRAELAEPFHEPQIVQDAAYNKGPRWIPLSELTEAFGYSREILQAIQQLISPPTHG